MLLQLKCNKIFTTDFNLVITKSSPISIQRSPTCTMMITAFDDSRVQFHMNMVKPIMSHSSPKMLFPAQPLTMLLLVGKPLPRTDLWRFFEILEIFFNQREEMKMIIKNWKVKKSYLKKLISSLSLNLSWPHISYRIAPLSKEKVAP